MKLTQRAIESFTFQGKNATAVDVRWDPELQGFGARIFPSGRKAYVIRYWFQGRRKYLTLGPTSVLSLHQARDLAKLRFAEVIQGSDPLERKRQAARGVTFADLAREYMEKHSQPKKKNWKDDERKLRDYVLKAWGSIRVDAITEADVVRLQHRIKNRDATLLPKPKVDQPVRHKPIGGPICANRTLSLLQNVFNKAKGLVGIDCGGTKNPVKGVERFEENERDRYASPDELKLIAKAIDEEPSVFLKTLIWMYLFTGMRRTELRVLKWTDVDLQLAIITQVDTKSGKPLHLPLTTAARALLEALPQFVDNPYVFCGDRAGLPIADVNTPWDRIRERAGIPDLWIHDLRATLASHMAQNGYSLPMIGRLLNQRSTNTTKRYARFQLEPLHKALEDGNRIIQVAAATSVPASVEPSQVQGPETSPLEHDLQPSTAPHSR